jgi:hypothetical protein
MLFQARLEWTVQTWCTWRASYFKPSQGANERPYFAFGLTALFVRPDFLVILGAFCVLSF